MQTITYSLKCGKSNSEEYFGEVDSFADEVLKKSAGSLVPIAEEYINYLKTYNLEKFREPEEYILELLSFGV